MKNVDYAQVNSKPFITFFEDVCAMSAPCVLKFDLLHVDGELSILSGFRNSTLRYLNLVLFRTKESTSVIFILTEYFTSWVFRYYYRMEMHIQIDPPPLTFILFICRRIPMNMQNCPNPDQSNQCLTCRCLSQSFMVILLYCFDKKFRTQISTLQARTNNVAKVIHQQICINYKYLINVLIASKMSYDCIFTLCQDLKIFFESFNLVVWGVHR